MVDLFSQYLRIKEEIDEAMQAVIRSSVFIKGGKVNDFELLLSEYLKTNVVACGNGTDALQLIFMALRLNPGDEVITTPFTFVSTVEVLAFLGLKPVFVDVDAGTFNLDAEKVADAISSKTRAILPVHLFGQNAEMEIILQIAEKNGLLVIEDAAQSFGSDYYFNDGSWGKSGTIGLAGITSFFPSKTLGAMGDGGAVFCQDPDLAKTIRSMANHGRNSDYQYDQIGINSRLDSIQAAILEVKFKFLDQFIQARQNAASYYDEKFADLPDLKIPGRANYSTHIFHQYTIQTSRRDELKKYLAVKEIPSMVYYPKPLHLQEAFRFLNYNDGDFPVSERLSETVLSLPMHTELDEKQLKYITTSVIEFFEKRQK